MRRAPLPPRDGLGPARLRVHGGPLGEELASRFGPEVAAKAVAGEVVDQSGAVLDPATVLPAGAVVYLYRELRDEVEVPFDIPVLYQDDDILVADKPHFLATMPRGRHVAQTALVRLRRQLGLDELSPAHRLDRLTAGVLLFTKRRELRGAYQTMFARGAVDKTYLARAAVDPCVALPREVRSRIIKRRGDFQAIEEAGEPNAVTFVELLSADGLYRLTPRTGRTHQLRVHMAALGLPIYGDPLYPRVISVADDDFSTPLQLLAQRLEFDDPFSGARREFVSARRLSAALDPWADQGKFGADQDVAGSG
ncbi:pseudouridine synthase [Mycobacterium paraterrae]|uniref:RNA pseudouridylate synthase n=1 Tax=Mycobacterium paraterrae TaxID=577492 RepID=A0ABY3VJ26_9MYCO|nr:pseudouridine synthase [Mycobacterium paraterrae]UMB68467.1 pseudouridine synthase [Mycobacterium paraterrae]